MGFPTPCRHQSGTQAHRVRVWPNPWNPVGDAADAPHTSDRPPGLRTMRWTDKAPPPVPGHHSGIHHRGGFRWRSSTPMDSLPPQPVAAPRPAWFHWKPEHACRGGNGAVEAAIRLRVVCCASLCMLLPQLRGSRWSDRPRLHSDHHVQLPPQILRVGRLGAGEYPAPGDAESPSRANPNKVVLRVCP